MNQSPAAMSRIMIIDDSVNGKSAIEDHLRWDGAVVESVADPVQGLQRLLADPPDLLIVDVAFAGVDSWSIIDTIRRNDRVKELPVVMVTGISDVDMRIRAYEMGADDVVQRPYNLAELNAMVRNVARLNRFRKLAEQREEIYRILLHVQESYDKTIEGWMRAMDLRDRETEGHSTRVAELTVLLGRQFGFQGADLINLRRGALLHDIGKLAIPDSILKKQGALNDEERNLMMKHPMHAHRMLYPIEYLRSALDIPVYHHEKFDGTGYPYRLAGDKIPLAARVFAVVDVWDALSFDRPYRKALDQETVKRVLVEETGRHFDPHIVPAFIRLLENIRQPIHTEEYWNQDTAA